MSQIYSEIKNQFVAMQKCAAYFDEHMDEIRTLFENTNPKSVVFMGCGSSFSIAKSMADTVNMRAEIPSLSLAAGDVAVHAARYAKLANGAIIVPISRSGSTSEIMLALDSLKANGAEFKVVGLSCVKNSRLSAYCALSLEMPWCFDESVCQTRTVSCLYYSVQYMLAKLLDDSELCNQLNTYPTIGERFVQDNEQQWEKIAALDWDHAVVLADAEIHGIAEEGALAFKEVCQLPSNCYHVLDVRHGPMVLIREKTLVITGIAGNKLECDLIQDLVSHKATVITCSSLPVEIADTINFFLGQSVDHIINGLLFIVVCQMIAYYKSGVIGTDPDHPDGLDAWIKL